jgi:hypothetical protein
VNCAGISAQSPNLKKRTLTNLYNQRPTWLKLAHEKLDKAVLAAYAAIDPTGGWSQDWATLHRNRRRHRTSPRPPPIRHPPRHRPKNPHQSPPPQPPTRHTINLTFRPFTSVLSSPFHKSQCHATAVAALQTTPSRPHSNPSTHQHQTAHPPPLLPKFRASRFEFHVSTLLPPPNPNHASPQPLPHIPTYHPQKFHLPPSPFAFRIFNSLPITIYKLPITITPLFTFPLLPASSVYTILGIRTFLKPAQKREIKPCFNHVQHPI